MKSSGIGGQAVLEGVMMKNKDIYAVAVRKPDGEIAVDTKEYKSFSDKHPKLKLPIIRGVVAFVESLMIGIKTLTFSASFYEEDTDKKEAETSKKSEGITNFLVVLASVGIAIGVFIVLPYFISQFLGRSVESQTVLTLLEGLIRIVLFVGYVVAISQMKDIKRVFMYHGAEHKTINCIEHGHELNVRNVRRQSKQHKRCGTSFMLIVMFVSIVFFIFIRVSSPWLRLLLRLILVPVIAGVSYEFIRLAGKSDSKVVDILSKPGLLLQRLTTKEPDDAMIEVAIQSVEAVFDWRAYLEENAPKKDKKRSQKNKKSNNKEKNKVLVTQQAIKEEAAAKMEIKDSASDHELDHLDKLLETNTDDQQENADKKVSELKGKVRTMDESLRTDINGSSAGHAPEEDDEILRALDKYFVFGNSDENEASGNKQG